MFVENLRIGELIARVRNGDVIEVILATNPTSEGDWTASYLLTQVSSHWGCASPAWDVGCPSGAIWSIPDIVTLARALESRETI